MAPHAWFAAELATYVHDLIAHEDGSDLVLLGALPSAWTQPGAVTHVERLPVNAGLLDLDLTPTETGATLTWKITPRDGIKSVRVRWPLPPWVTATSVSGPPLTARSGSNRHRLGPVRADQGHVTRAPDQGPTWAGTIAAIQAAT